MRELIRRLGRSRQTAAIAALVAIAAASPFVLSSGDNYVIQAVARVLILGLLVLSTELAWGQTGIFTLGQAVFFGVGAYSAGMLATRLDITELIVLLPLATVAGLVAGGLISLFLFSGKRVSELYVALFTLALTYVAQRAASSWAAIGAANGIPGIPLPTIFGQTIMPGPAMFWMAFAALAVSMPVCLALVQSQFGLLMNAVRDDEQRAEFLGYRRARVQMIVLTVSGGLAALSGGLFAVTEGFVSPSLLGVALSTSAALWVVLGGRGSFFGPLIGLALLEYLGRRMQNALPEFWPIIVGLILLLTIILVPRGLMSIPDSLRSYRSRRSAAA